MCLFKIFMAIISGVMQMAGTGEQLEDIGDARSAISSLLGIPTSADDDPFDQAVSQLDTVLGKLDVFNVYFHYPSRPEYQLLKSINFTVGEGQTVALLGDKGCGKSALMKLLQRIYDPQNGRVKLDGQDIRFLDRRWLRRQIGIVHKKPEFFNTSIADNIAYGKTDSTLKEIVRASKDTGAHEFIMDLPKGYATILNDDGSPLTSFQKHLLALARAIIRKPRILLWEEDLSVMDSSALNVLTNYLDQARHGRTTVVSTSHVSVAHIADVIIVLHNGEIIEQGTPKELMMSGGAFRYLATLQHFESQSLHLEKLQKSEQVSETKSPVQNGKEIPESSSKEQWEETSYQVKGFTSKLRQMIQDRLNEGQAAYKMIWMQLKDLPLLLAGALGAAITGMVAPGLSFLFGEIQKFMNDPLRVAKEGPFWASMFVVFGLFIGFGGTIEKFMLTYATEKLRSRLQKIAFDTTINKNSVPQIPGVADISYSLSAAGQQFPSVSQTPGMGLPGRLGMPSADGVFSQVPPSATTGSPSLGAFQGLTDMPTGISSVQGLTGLSSGILPSQGLASATGTPYGIFSSQGFVGLSGLPTETTLIQGLAGISGIPQAIPSDQNLQRITGFPAGILPGAIGNELGKVVPGVVGGDVGAILSGSSVDGGLGAVVVGTVGEGLGAKVPGVLGGGIGPMVSGSVEGGLGAILPSAVGKGIEGMIPGAVNKGLEAVVPGAVSGGLEPSLSGDAESSLGVLIPRTVGGSVAAIIPGVVSGGIGDMFSGAVSGGAEAVMTGAASEGLGAIVSSKVGSNLKAMAPGTITGITGAVLSEAVGGGLRAVVPASVTTGPGALGSAKAEGDLAILPARESGVTGAVLSVATGGGLGAMVPGSVTTGLGTIMSLKAETGLGAIIPGAGSGFTGAALTEAVGGGLGAMVTGKAGSGLEAIVPTAAGGVTGAALSGAVVGGLGAMVPGAVTEGIGSMVAGSVGGSGNIPNANLLLLPDPQKQADHLMEQVEKDVEAALQNSIGKYLGTKVQETISSVSTLGMALYNGWKMTLVVLAGLPIIGVANRIQQNEIDATVEPEGVEALMKTSFKKLETISALGVENKFAKKYKDAIFEQYKRTLKKIIASGFAFALGQAMVFFIYAGALRFGCYLITIGDMTPIQVLGVLMTVLFGSYATASSRAPTHAPENNEDSLNRLLDDQATEVKDLVGDKLNDVKGSLDFKNVEFPDPLVQGKSLLSHLNAKVSEGQTLALVPLDNETLNPLELLVERFFAPTRGTLFLDGTDIQGLDLSWLRAQYAVVSHRCFLPQYSIAENISYGNEKRAFAVTRREIEDAAYSAYAHEFIMELPKGYDTLPDEDQISLNESQKMRIVIARAIIRGPPIIVLDELEEESQAVNDATHILCRNRTCLILTRHRQTIEAADHIALMYRGRVIEQGTLEDLQNQGRLYNLLTSLQDVDED
ncbi:unnamed protein product [Porites lobata]|uniref:Uncharacterized protein n=1 Tax=Porites lobata TaxID=104759 RepID=A0ABN8RVQ0_9CNID|nr:unnamed protein product [Porites lobata]